MKTVVKNFRVVALVVVVAAALATGCSKTPPPEIADANRALKNAAESCATVYAPAELAAVQPIVDGMNEFANDKKYKKAAKQAEALMPAIQNVQTVTDQRRELAREALDADMQRADDTMVEADAARKEAEKLTAGSRSAAAGLAEALADADAARVTLDTALKGAPASAGSDLGAAEAGMAELMAAIRAARAAQAGADFSMAKHEAAVRQLNEAKSLAEDPCTYGEAEAAAERAQLAADEARLAAIAAARLATDQQAAVAALIADLERETREALALAALISSVVREYTVVKGDYLWKISGMNQIYAAPKFWPLIFDANRGQIKNPDLIFPGQNLSIPRQMEAREMMDVLRVMWGKASRGEDL